MQSRFLITMFAALLALSIHEVAKSAQQGQIALSSVYNAEPVKLGNQSFRRLTVLLSNERGMSSAQLVLDLNHCTLNKFGDVVLSTQMAHRPLNARLTRQPMLDSKRGHRTVYRIESAELGVPVYLVIGARGEAASRLVVCDQNSEPLTVIGLE